MCASLPPGLTLPGITRAQGTHGKLPGSGKSQLVLSRQSHAEKPLLKALLHDVSPRKTISSPMPHSSSPCIASIFSNSLSQGKCSITGLTRSQPPLSFHLISLCSLLHHTAVGSELFGRMGKAELPVCNPISHGKNAFPRRPRCSTAPSTLCPPAPWCC